jgi:hypothetical protein
MRLVFVFDLKKTELSGKKVVLIVMRKIKLVFCFLLPVALWSFYCLPVEAVDAKQLEAVSKTLDAYMKNNIAAAEEGAMEKTYEFDSQSPVVLLLDYLSGNRSIKPSHIILAAEKDPDLSAMVSLCLFARVLSSQDAKLDSFELENYLCNYLDDLKSCKTPVPKTWKPRVEAWLAWCRSDFKYSKGLDPLLAARCGKSSVSKDAGKKPSTPTVPATPRKAIKDITYEDFCATRSAFKNRPRPGSLDFNRADVQKYIDKLSSVKLKKDEAMRCNVVNKFKPYLVVLLSKTPYHGKIALKNKRFTGTVYMANQNSLRIKRKSNSLRRSYKWSDLSPEQYVLFIKYYAKQRTDGFGAVVSKKERARQAAEDYLQLAFFCDWLGMYKDALNFAKLSVSLSPDIEPSAQKFIYGID